MPVFNRSKGQKAVSGYRTHAQRRAVQNTDAAISATRGSKVAKKTVLGFKPKGKKARGK